MTADIRDAVLSAKGFTLPDAYVALYEAGRLLYGRNRDDWEANWATIAMESPPALLCAPWFMTVEWKSIDEIVEWTSPDHWKPNRFVSFAGNGYGDQWVWDPDRVSERGTAVLLCRHDDDMAEIVASSFDDFLYRILLESLAHISYDDRDGLQVDDDGFRRYLDLNIQAVAPFISPAHVETLYSILRNDFVDDEEEERIYLLSDADKKRIIARDLLVGDVGTTVQHTTHEPHKVSPAVVAARAAARDLLAAKQRRDQYEQAAQDADIAFRQADYAAYCTLLSPFLDLLSPAQQRKLEFAQRKLDRDNNG